MGLFSRLFAAQTPAWQEPLSAPQRAAFEAQVEILKGALEAEFDTASGALVRGDRRWLLGPLARRLKDQPASLYPELFERHLAAVREGERVDQLLDRLRDGAAALDEITPHIRVTVRDRRSWGVGIEELLARPLAGDLVELLLIDTPNTMVFPKRSMLAALDRSDDAWFADARARTADALHTKVTVQELALSSGPAVAYGCDNACAFVALGAGEGTRPALWIAPSQGGAIRVLPADPAEMAAAAAALVQTASELMQRTREPLSDQLFARVHGELVHVAFGTVTTDDAVHIVDGGGALSRAIEAAFTPRHDDATEET